MGYNLGDAVLDFMGGAAKQYNSMEKEKRDQQADLDKSIATMTSQALLQQMNTDYNTKAKANEETRKFHEQIEAAGGLNTLEGRVLYYKNTRDTEGLSQNDILDRVVMMDPSEIRMPEYRETSAIGGDLLGTVKNERVRETLQAMFNSTDQRLKAGYEQSRPEKVEYRTISGEEVEGYKLAPDVAKYLDTGGRIQARDAQGNLLFNVGKDVKKIQATYKYQGGAWWKLGVGAPQKLDIPGMEPANNWKVTARNFSEKQGGWNFVAEDNKGNTKQWFAPSTGTNPGDEAYKVYKVDSVEPETGEKVEVFVGARVNKDGGIDLAMEEAKAVRVGTSTSDAVRPVTTDAREGEFAANHFSKGNGTSTPLFSQPEFKGLTTGERDRVSNELAGQAKVIQAEAAQQNKLITTTEALDQAAQARLKREREDAAIKRKREQYLKR